MAKARQPKEKPEEKILKPGEELTALSSAEEIPQEEDVVIEEPQEEDIAATLQQQLDALKKSEEIQRQRADQANRDREEALKKAREREVEVTRFQKEAEESQYDAIASALAAATAEAEKAQNDIENAVTLGDTKAQAAAYRKLAKAEANISRLEDGKTQIEETRKVAKEKPPEQQQPLNDPIAQSGLPLAAQDWLRKHPDYVTDARKNAKIGSLHWDVVDEGFEPFSPEYFTSIETHLGLRQPERKPEQQQQRTNIVSAPVSREVPTSTPQQRNGKITLTAAQVEAAKMAGVTPAEYAKQLQKLNEMKANGTYGDRQ